MNKLPKFAVVCLVVCGVLIGIGCIMAVNSCASNSQDEPNPLPPVENYFPGLETVILPNGTPEQIKEYTGFTVSFNKENHTPNYVAWELLDSEIAYDIERTDNFWKDNEIEGCPAHKDYSYSGYDRGHMCPAADQKWSKKAMEDCFVMANMCPQDHQLNAGAWNTLESKERQWAKRDGLVMIIAGPIYEGEGQKRIGDLGIRVPDAFFKVLLAPYIDNPRAIAFVYPNMDSPGNMQGYALSVDKLEEMLGYDFFAALPDELENKVEAVYSFTEWNSSK